MPLFPQALSAAAPAMNPALVRTERLLRAECGMGSAPVNVGRREGRETGRPNEGPSRSRRGRLPPRPALFAGAAAGIRQTVAMAAVPPGRDRCGEVEPEPAGHMSLRGSGIRMSGRYIVVKSP
ncbi:hypothetical protein GCM10011578_054360 [Streptomyces fuscichromogenes]|uniref:Uncharacterized protein n=1 Tax=Streptomyces fuscichromogenes TaxID=1324013 RepID=A0A917XG70_9ACTN|nr:hypothetical protein GCM10011578_054360 [Streptomyces fuscichromogenes]